MDAKDKNVAKVVIYVKNDASGLKPYVDEACTIECSRDELCGAFEKGAILYFMEDGNVTYKAVPIGIILDTDPPVLIATSRDRTVALIPEELK